MAQLMVNSASTMPIGSYSAQAIDEAMAKLRTALGQDYTGRVAPPPSSSLAAAASATAAQSSSVSVSSFIIRAPDSSELQLSQQEFDSMLIMREIKETRHLFRPPQKPGSSRKRQSALLNCPLNTAQAAAVVKAKHQKRQQQQDKKKIVELLSNPDYIPQSSQVWL
jgi:hypothetical protein